MWRYTLPHFAVGNDLYSTIAHNDEDNIFIYILDVAMCYNMYLDFLLKYQSSSLDLDSLLLLTKVFLRGHPTQLQHEINNTLFFMDVVAGNNLYFSFFSQNIDLHHKTHFIVDNQSISRLANLLIDYNMRQRRQYLFLLLGCCFYK